MKYSTGWMADRPDPDDFPAAAVLGSGPVPVSSDNRALVPNVLDQGPYSSCVANAVAQAVRASLGGHSPVLARMALYWLARREARLEKFDGGCYIRDAFKALVDSGWAPEWHWSYDKPVVGKGSKPDLFLLREAATKWRGQYRRIWEVESARVDAVKRALASGRLVVFGTSVGQTFMSGDTRRPAADAVYGHAMCLHSHDGDVFTGVNSWSENWGQRGHFLMDADYMAWSETRDLWIIDSAVAA